MCSVYFPPWLSKKKKIIKDLEEFPPGGFYPEERVSIYDAVRGFTTMAAYGALQDYEFGSLEPTKAADFLLLDRDIIAEADGNFRAVLDANLLATIFAGNCVYEAAGVNVPLCA